MKTKEEVIRALFLAPLPGEGGFFRQTARGPEDIPCRLRSSGEEVFRPSLTAILFLVGGEDFSALHWLEFGELFHFRDGAPCELVQVTPGGVLSRSVLGGGAGELEQAYVPAGNLQGLRSLGEWSLVGAVMGPGFDYADLHLPSRQELLGRFPHLRAEVERFTRG
jgi:predicted cupin superfamily sugar epimerase